MDFDCGELGLRFVDGLPEKAVTTETGLAQRASWVTSSDQIGDEKAIYRQLSLGMVIVLEACCSVPKPRTDKYDNTAPHIHSEN